MPAALRPALEATLGAQGERLGVQGGGACPGCLCTFRSWDQPTEAVYGCCDPTKWLCVPAELGCSCQFLNHMSLGWEYSQCSKHGAQSSAANPDEESGVSGLAGAHEEGMRRTLPSLQDAVCSPNCPVPCPTGPADPNCPGGGCSLHRAGNKVGGGVEKRSYLPAGESPRYQGLPRCAQCWACGAELQGAD